MTSESQAPIAFAHVGLQVADLDQSIEFYRDLIGLELIERGVRRDAYLKQVVGQPDVDLDIAVLAVPGEPFLLELLEYLNVDRQQIDPNTVNTGTAHVCFRVPNVDEVYRRVIAAGYRSVSEPVTPTSGRWTGGRSVYLLDPDEIRVELVQPGEL